MRYWLTLPFVIIILFIVLIVSIPFLILGKVDWWEIGEEIDRYGFMIVDVIRGGK